MNAMNAPASKLVLVSIYLRGLSLTRQAIHLLIVDVLWQAAYSSSCLPKYIKIQQLLQRLFEIVLEPRERKIEIAAGTRANLLIKIAQRN